MKILFTLCGRAGSKGIKGKNVMLFLGKPLALYSLSCIDLFLKKHEDIEADVILNTDSMDLGKIFSDQEMRNVILIERKPSLAGDTAPKSDVIKDSLNQMENKGKEYDMVIDLDITSPLRTVGDLERVVNAKTADHDVVFTVVESRRNPCFNMVVRKSDGYYGRVIESDFTARQQAGSTYDMNASIYAYDIDFLKSDKAIFDGKCGIVEMRDTGVLDLDKEYDLELMEIIGEKLYSDYDDYKVIRENIK